MPSGRFDNATATSRDTLTPPWRTVRPSTNDSGIPSRTEPSTMANGDPSACTPSGVLRSPPPWRDNKPVTHGENRRPDQDQQGHPRDRAGLDSLVDELVGDRADQQPRPGGPASRARTAGRRTRPARAATASTPTSPARPPATHRSLGPLGDPRPVAASSRAGRGSSTRIAVSSIGSVARMLTSCSSQRSSSPTCLVS